jgi:hypothetical protein
MNINDKIQKIKEDINGYHDIVSDLRDEWNDLNGILDMGVEREWSILKGIKSLIDSFEEDIFKSVDRIEKLKENE